MRDFGLVLTVSGKMYKLTDDDQSTYAIHTPPKEKHRTVTIDCDDPMDYVDRIEVHQHFTDLVVYDKIKGINEALTLEEKSGFIFATIHWYNGEKMDVSIIPLFWNCAVDDAEYDRNVRRTAHLTSAIEVLEKIDEFAYRAKKWQGIFFRPYKRPRL